MVLDLGLAREVSTYVDHTTGLVDRRVFSSEEVYRLELEQIFARAWLFMAHDTQIPNPGDFFMTSMGEDRVIVVRDRDGNPQVLVNSCRHRGNAVCRAEEGNTTSFMCTYHGWTYDLDGKLIGVPGYKEVYHEELDRDAWGLIKPAQVDSYKGFIFATMDAEAPSLHDYLGEVGRMSLDLVAHRGSGNVRMVPGIQKYTIPCNWKLAADNVWDFYHPFISHRSQALTQWRTRQAPIEQTQNFSRRHQVLLGEFGHALAGPENNEENRALQPDVDHSWRERPEVQRALGPVGMRANSHPHIFPNMWITYPGFAQISMRFPKGPTSTEIWWFTMMDEELPNPRQQQLLRTSIHNFGPAGMLEQDDGENWGESTRAAKGVVSMRYPVNYSMGLGHGEIVDDESGPPFISTIINEHPQLWHYRNWAQWMGAGSWAELKANHPLPEGTV